MAAANNTVTNSKGTATVVRRGAQSARGVPIRVNTMGAAMNTPMQSPIHQVAQVNGKSA